MALRSDAAGWGSMAKTLHWIMALLIIGVAFVGWTMTDLPTSPQKIKIYALHKSFGLTVLALGLLRLAWRLGERRPAEPPMPRWQALAARATHLLLYVIILAMPITGWLYNSASGYPLQWFGLFNLPNLTGGKDADIKPWALLAHEIGFYALLLALAAHVGGALKHHFLDRDDVLRGMLPGRRRAAPPAPAPAPEPVAAPAVAPAVATPTPPVSPAPVSGDSP